MNYYNEIEPFAVKWLKNLIADGLIPEGDVDERSIKDVKGTDLKGYTQCHFFAGIGGWSRALELAGWDSTRPVWTGSCPCQSLSVAGLGKGHEDERHLWPEFARLICECEPSTVFGEQVASKLGREWLAGVRLDLEEMGYVVGAADLCAAGVGAPHIRQRLWWVADSNEGGRAGECRSRKERTTEYCDAGFWSNSIWWPCRDGKWRRVPGRLAIPEGQRLQEPGCTPEAPGGIGGISDTELQDEWRGIQGQRESDCKMEQQEQEQRFIRDGSSIQHAGYDRLEVEPDFQFIFNGVSEGMGLFSNADKENFPLSPGRENRVGILRGAGNAIVPQVAAQFIRAFMS